MQNTANSATQTDTAPFLESEMYEHPERTFMHALQAMNIDSDTEIQEYIQQVLKSDDRKGEKHQQTMRVILERLLAAGEKEKAGLMFNIHRVLTEFEGYGASDKKSSDVEACFGEKYTIPDEGAIVIDFFVTRNLPAIIKQCEDRGIDISRIRVHVPRAILALQLMLMSAQKRLEFEEACEKLTAGQFRVPDVHHVGDIYSDGPVAIWFSPRTMPIHPRLHAETEEETIRNYRLEFWHIAFDIVDDGRIYVNLAFSKTWQPLSVESENKTRPLTKLTGISEEVAIQCVKVLIGEGFIPVNSHDESSEMNFDPANRNPKIDHVKHAKELHFTWKKK